MARSKMFKRNNSMRPEKVFKTTTNKENKSQSNLVYFSGAR